MVAIAARLSGAMLKRRLIEPARLFRFLGSNDIDCRWNRAPGLWVSARIFERISMPTISPSVLPVLMLFASNVFMTFAWYGHLKFKASWLPVAVLVSWGIAFFEYWLAVPANRWGSAVYSAAQLKTMQEVITMLLPGPFRLSQLKELAGCNHAHAF